MEERELFGGLDGEGGDGEGGGRRSREAGDPLSLLPRWDWKQLSHLQTLFNPQVRDQMDFLIVFSPLYHQTIGLEIF